MRQQDYKMVQGVNQIVQMNPNIAAQSGNAMARLGQQLAQTGQDVSNVMQYTAEAQDKTTLIRGRQKWKEIQAEQEAFQIENKKDPLSWEANRVKLMKKFDTYNSEAKLYTKNGKLNYQLSSEGFSSDLEIFTGRSVTKRINMNLADETIAEVKLALANNDPEGAEYALGQGGDSLTEDASATMQLQIKKGYEKRVMDNEKEMSKSDPAGYIEDLKDRKDLTNDQQDKLFSYSSNQQNIQAREQLDDLEEAINTGDGVSLEDFKQMEEEGKFSQVPAGDLAKTKAGMERGLPLSNTELSKVNGESNM